MIDSKAAGGIAVPEHHDTFAHRGIIVKERREARDGQSAVGGLEIKGDERVRALPRNGGAEQTIPSDGVASGSIIFHRDGGVTGSGINAVIEGEALHAIGIMHPRGDDGRLVGCRQRWRMAYLVNCRAGIDDISAVPRAWCAEVGRHGHWASGFQPVSI